ncbi:MAG: hypothetical protein A2521_09765 [Deltaproteobacteria bacterium RIFOXYD12_FULL_57_12]|nr:MAG: hypothetical protein A2521_09765 [Deltaproteobacteria bacterium RIFOXYD12_FULL_57_12]
MDKDPPPDSSDSSDSSDFKRLLSQLWNFLGFNRSPDTTEDLEQEIQELLEEGEEQGLISSQEGRMINSIFDFRDTLAHEIMTPRSELVGVEVSLSIPEVVRLINENGFSRIPVYEETLDNIVGILHAKDLLTCLCPPDQGPGLRDLVKPAYFIAENKRIVELLKEFQARKIHLALVTDEFGGIRGLITIEDVLEELVGEIDDEYDTDEERWQVLEDGSLLTVAKVDIEEVEEFFHVKFPEGPYESVGGLITQQLGRVPKNGETMEINSLMFRVVAATKRHIKTVKISRI